MKDVRVRFAPSPTGGLHLGGVRTALYSYLFAKKHNGTFVLRVEDTDQTRFVEGAEQYIIDCLTWCGIMPSEGPHAPGKHAPYRQSERKDLYATYALQLVEQGNAYFAFDTTEELEKMRTDLKSEDNPSPQYDKKTRMAMNNSLSLSKEVVDELLAKNTPYVIRINTPANETISFEDIIRGTISNDSNLLDDKVLLKADGMPTYHLAVVVDDFLMEISHAFRGEEWLPSAPTHVLLWKYLFGLDAMPQWAHLPLILKPDGNGKLSKRDGERLGFPVFAMNWKDPEGNVAEGFKEKGFLPEAFLNMLVLLGWNNATEQELFSLDELIEKFELSKVHKGGAKFDFQKALYFNHEWIKKSSAERLLPLVQEVYKNHELTVDDKILLPIIDLVKERCPLINDFYEQSIYFFKDPETIDLESLQAKWTAEKNSFFNTLAETFQSLEYWRIEEIEHLFKTLATEKNIKMGELQLPFRIMLVGGKFGPGVFHIAEIIGKESTITRINTVLQKL
jgi:glutamyl-tRNA synthetase